MRGVSDPASFIRSQLSLQSAVYRRAEERVNGGDGWHDRMWDLIDQICREIKRWSLGEDPVKAACILSKIEDAVNELHQPLLLKREKEALEKQLEETLSPQAQQRRKTAEDLVYGTRERGAA